MRVFLDTNVVVSAFATRGLCEDVMRTVLIEHELLIGVVVLEETERVLNHKFKMPTEAVESVIEMLREQELVPTPREAPIIDIQDADDIWIVASALEGQADVLVTGDRELLELRHIGELRILDPREFWNLLSKA